MYLPDAIVTLTVVYNALFSPITSADKSSIVEPVPSSGVVSSIISMSFVPAEPTLQSNFADP